MPVEAFQQASDFRRGQYLRLVMPEVRQAYLARAAASPERFCVVDAARPQTEVTAAVLKEAAAWL